MDSKPPEDTNHQAKRKIDETDVNNDGAIVKRPKASDSQSNPDAESVSDSGEYNLLHFSDDVMLYILQYCSPHELKALSFCCRRLARLCMDRSLWKIVELRQQASGTRALSFYVHCLRSNTSSFYIRGLLGSSAVKNEPMRMPPDCLCAKSDFVASMRRKLETHCRHLRCRPGGEPIPANNIPLNRRPAEEGESSKKSDDAVKEEKAKEEPLKESDSSCSSSNSLPSGSSTSQNTKKILDWLNTSRDEGVDAGTSTADLDSSSQPGPSSSSPRKPYKENGNTSPKPFSAAYEDYPKVKHDTKKKEKDKGLSHSKKNKKPETAECCKNKSVCMSTMNKDIMVEIKQRCGSLTDLRLEYCNLDCNSLPLSDFPKTLKILSLRGSKRTNLAFHKTYLFKIQDHLPVLEELDLSYCGWLSGHSLLLLSKMKFLRKLWLRGCSGLGECVAYASLSTRFGFKALELLDVRGTSMGDSEVSGFGSLESLRELYLEPPKMNANTSITPIGWPEHSGVMEVWETQHPFKEVEEYIQSMNKEELSETNTEPKPESSNGTKNSTDDKKSRGESSRPRRGNIPGPGENIGLLYRSIVNLAYPDRNPQVMQNVQQRPNANNDQNPQLAPGQGRAENPRENQIGVHIGPRGYQIGPLGVQVGPVRLQMRHRADGPPPEVGEAQQRMPGVQVGPVEVQVGPEGVQVGLGEVRVDPGWVREGPEGGRVQVELGGVRVDPGWMHFGPAGVQVGFGGMQVGPVEVQVGPDRGENQVEVQDVQLGPIEVQLGEVRVEVGGDGRPIRVDEGNNNAGQAERQNEARGQPAERPQPNRENPPRAPPRFIVEDDLHDFPFPDFPGLPFNPFWNMINPMHDRHMEMGPVGVHVHLRQRPVAVNREGEQREGEQPNNQDHPRINRRNWVQVERDGALHVALGELHGLMPGVRVGNLRRQNAEDREEPEAPRVPGAEVPQVPGAEAPRVPGAEAPRVPEAEAPRVPGVEAPRVPGAEAPRVPGAEAPRAPGAEAPRVPGAGAPRVPGAGAPRGPGAGAPRVLVVEVPRAPRAEVPRVPGAEAPRFPAVEILWAGAGDVHHLPRNEVPRFIGFEIPRFPGFEVPQVPGAEVPRVPGAEVPQVPGAEVPRVPGAEVPRVPGVEVPRFPAAEVPRVPGAEVPRFPAAEVPRVPGAEVPRFPAAEVPRFPAAEVPRVPRADVPRFPAAEVPRVPGAEAPRFPGVEVLWGPGAEAPRVPEANPEAPNDEERQRNRDRGFRRSFLRRIHDLGPNDPRRNEHQNPPNAPPPQNPENREREQPRPEGLPNIMEGRVHVIYVDPRYPRRPAAELLVAAGMPHNAEVLHDDVLPWAGRQEFHVRDLPQIFDVPLIQLPFLNVGNLRHLDGTELVTDVSLLRLGESEQLIHVGGQQGRRRRSSNLEVLVCRGFRGVTDQSLTHLAAAAPALRHLDVEDCGVSAAGVAAFANHRPDCKLNHNVNQPTEDRNNAPQ